MPWKYASTIGDVAVSFDAIVGRGELLDADSYEALIDPALVGFGEPLDNDAPPATR